MKRHTETELMHRIRESLTATGHITLWRNNVGFDLERKVRYGLGLGSPDLVGVLRPHGRLACFEVKTPTGRISVEQRAWHSAARGAGAFVAIVRSTDEAVLALHRALGGACE